MEKIGAILLAAGGSARLGEPKQLLQHRGVTLIRRAADAALAAGCDPVVVVTGAAHERVGQELTGLCVRVHHHELWERGIGSSIRAGVEQATRESPALDAVLIMVCDQPFVTVAVLAELLATHLQTQKPIVACAYSGTVGVPALFDRTLFPMLAALPNDRGAKHVLASLPQQVAHVAFPEGAIDIDTPDDRRAHLAG